MTARRPELDHAGLLARGLAWFLDGIVMFLGALALLLPLFFLLPSTPSSQAAEGVGGLVGLVFGMVYYAGTEATWGQTPGKMMLGIRVVNVDGRPCSAAGAVIRNITKVLGGSAIFPVLVAIILILATDDDQRLGDMLGGTTVVHA
ncbi:RDD family protein [Salinadaptatus halalkaliphilus]|uniref:RDD family protein n=1 Tax=Salinadaptatus halalkaliphilus TaxID=2419781 RepID=A0A4S3TG18_9EURY|nr:RDD family protein [Salinadaptatus halalkaliphilus]THE62762.1 RDD family protein [Salinadaptatus halalkaliphilus]